MPKFLEEKLKKEYPNNPHAVYGTMNKLGVMKGNKETKKGKVEEKKHDMAKKMEKKPEYDPAYYRTHKSAIKKAWKYQREHFNS